MKDYFKHLLILLTLFATPVLADDVPLNSIHSVITQGNESPEAMRQRVLSTVESAKQYQDMMDDQLSHLKGENAELHEKLSKLKQQFGAIANQVQEDVQKRVQLQKKDPAKEKLDFMKPIIGSMLPKTNPTKNTSEKIVNIEPTKIEPVKSANSPTPSAKKFTPQYNNKTEQLLVGLTNLKLAGGLIALSLLVLAWLFWTQRATQQYHYSEPEPEPTPSPNITRDQTSTSLVTSNQEGEYDYISSLEAIPVKLDLAHMYINMGDMDSAKAVLDDVITQGNEAQQEEAQDLLKKTEE